MPTIDSINVGFGKKEPKESSYGIVKPRIHKKRARSADLEAENKELMRKLREVQAKYDALKESL